MNTWIDATYIVTSSATSLLMYSIESSAFVSSVSVRVEESSGMPIIDKIKEEEFAKTHGICVNDIIYCINDTYFETTDDVMKQAQLFPSILTIGKRLVVKLISRSRFFLLQVPRIEQIIVSDNALQILLGSFLSNVHTCIMSISSKMYSSISGSILLAINDEIVLNKTTDSTIAYLNTLICPLVLFIACPYQQSPLTVQEIIDYMSYNGFANSQTSSYMNKEYSKTSSVCDHPLALQKQRDYSASPYAVDAYMFPQSQGYALLEQQWKDKNKEKDRITEQNWKDFLNAIGGASALNFSWTRQSGNRWSILHITNNTKNRHQLRFLLHKGCPSSLRPDVWYHLSGGYELKQRSINTYEQIYKSQINQSIQMLIEQDLPRTFPTHPMFSSGIASSPSHCIQKEESPLIASLRNILYGISVLREDIQYCQGMNIIAGFLLLVITDEEKAFWIMAAILQYMFPINYFDDTLSGARVDEALFEDVLEKRFPQLYTRLKGFDKDIISISLSWFMKLFVGVLPISTVARIWDIMIMEGDKAILRIAAALIGIMEPSLMLIEDDTDFANFFKQIGTLQFDADELISAAYQKRSIIKGESPFFPYKRAELHEWRNEKRKQIEKKASTQPIMIEDSDEDE